MKLLSHKEISQALFLTFAGYFRVSRLMLCNLYANKLFYVAGLPHVKMAENKGAIQPHTFNSESDPEQDEEDSPGQTPSRMRQAGYNCPPQFRYTRYPVQPVTM